MTVLDRMMYCSTQSGYSAQLGDDVTMVDLPGGAPRFRRSINGTYHTVNVQWILGPKGFEYLTAFYRRWKRNPNKPFLAKLCVDAPLVEDYKCHFSSSPTINGKQGKFFTITAQLRVRPLETSDALDDLIVEAGNQGHSLSDLFDPLDKLVNKDLPNALGDVING